MRPLHRPCLQDILKARGAGENLEQSTYLVCVNRWQKKVKNDGKEIEII